MEIIRGLYREWKDSPNEHNRERLIAAIWQTYHPKLQVFLSSCPDCLREDRVSEILLHVFEKLDRYNPDYAFSTWLYRLARNRNIDLLRRSEESPIQWDEDFDVGHDETPEEAVLREVDRELISQAIEDLAPRDRQILFLAYYEEVGYAEISQVLEIPLGTVKYRIHRIKKILKNQLEEEFCYGTE